LDLATAQKIEAVQFDLRAKRHHADDRDVRVSVQREIPGMLRTDKSSRCMPDSGPKRTALFAALKQLRTKQYAADG